MENRLDDLNYLPNLRRSERPPHPPERFHAIHVNQCILGEVRVVLVS